MYGFPSVFYGDEAGIEGYGDPFCRKPFPWHNINNELLCHYKKLGEIRQNNSAFDSGAFEITEHHDGLIAYKRTKGDCEIIVCANTQSKEETLSLDGAYMDLLTQETFTNTVCLSEMEARILKKA